MVKSIGIDLAGLEKNPTGIAIMNSSVRTLILHTNEEIINFVVDENPDIVVIDAPLSFPTNGLYRSCELEMKKDGFNPLSPVFKGMRPLVERGIKIAIKLREHSINTFETYSKAIRKILMIDNKFMKSRYPNASEDELDAILCALVGKLHMNGRTKSYGKENLILPKSI